MRPKKPTYCILGVLKYKPDILCPCPSNIPLYGLSDVPMGVHCIKPVVSEARLPFESITPLFTVISAVSTAL